MHALLATGAIILPQFDPAIVTIPAFELFGYTLGPFPLRWYSLAYIVGLLFGWWYARIVAQRVKAPVTRQHLDDYLLWATFGVIIGGRLGYVIFYKPSLYLARPLEILALSDGGMSFHGGLMGIIITAILFTRRHRIPTFAFADILACVAPVGLFLGRCANFINGELWGRRTDVAWGMVFPDAGPDPRHPSQLYEAALEGLILFAVLFWLSRQAFVRHHRGTLAGTFFIGYGLSRFAVEYVREPDRHLGLLAGFISMGQILCLPMIAFGVFLILYPRMTDPARTKPAGGR